MSAHLTRGPRLPAAVALLAIAVFGLAGCQLGRASPAPSATAGPTRQDLGNTLPETARGERLGLWKVTIPPGTALAPHTHPGWQVARIVSGRLSYTITEGHVTLIHADGTQIELGVGTIEIQAGETVVENPDVKHYGANNGTTPVEIYIASLLTDGQPPAIPLASTAPAASP
jgi:quercetin dioxygenase-like cupin family protein